MFMRSSGNVLKNGLNRRFRSVITPAKQKKWRFLKNTSWKLYLFTFCAGATLGLNIPLYSIPDQYLWLLPKNELDVEKYKQDLEKQLQLLPIVNKLSKDPNYIKIRAWENIIDSSIFNETMTSSTLRQPGGVAIEPLVFVNEKSKETISIIHLGKKLTGYPFLVHGGILATVLDETLKRCSILHEKHSNLKYDDETTYSHIRGTDLTLSYRFPTLANNFVVVKAKCEDLLPDGSIPVTLKIQTLKGRDLVLGKGVFKDSTSKKWFFW